MGKEKGSSQEVGNDKPKLRFHLIKARDFRTVHIDGVYGGIGPHGNIHMNCFTERNPIPQVLVHEFDPDNSSLGPEIVEERVSRDGIIREIEFSISMDCDTASNLVKWLKEKIDILESGSEPQKLDEP